MNKYIARLAIVMFLIFLFPNTAWAHTGLQSSSPANAEVVTSEVDRIELTFNTKIEPLSGITVQDGNGEEIQLKKIETGKNSIVGLTEAPLQNGTYTVNWRIIGEDGHAINGTYSFIVQATEQALEETNNHINYSAAEEPEENSNPSDEPAANDAEQLSNEVSDGSETVSAEPVVSQEQLTATAAVDSGTWWKVAAIVVCVLLLFYMVWNIRRT
ncbi:copper resistance CopC family protein [Paenibacillus abyssi]|uniref:CopC domain-containing protein n=1 Tax=Paenibacillus abyssi TaxID=1340531 RepID=A0A917FYP2_9BACL|nr:copper resistance CopC family protein [Paenibacillus abyssi]GGG14369.1 hypothetical protein GCM10010916_34100 [Paenibacillus abyssi]